MSGYLQLNMANDAFWDKIETEKENEKDLDLIFLAQKKAWLNNGGKAKTVIISRAPFHVMRHLRPNKFGPY